MYQVIITYLVVSSIVAIGMLLYVGVDVLVEALTKRREPEPEPEVPIAPIIVEPILEPILEPEPEPEPEPVILPERVDHIDAEEADEMISSDLAMRAARYESGAGTGKQGIINLGDIDRVFEPYDIITLAVLKERGMMAKKVGRMKILADGILTKPIIVKSESYSVEAIKMIELTGGTVIILRD